MTWQQVVTAAQAKNGWSEDQLDTAVVDAIDSNGGQNLPADQLAGVLGITQDDINQYGGTTVSTPTQTPTIGSQIDQMETDLVDVRNRLATIEQREALTMDAIAKMIANRILGFDASNLEGPGSAAADVDAVEAKPAVEQQVQFEQPAGAPANP